MPRQTYFNLSEEKRARIYGVLVKAFEKEPMGAVTVKQIVEALSLPRGSFYQYFDSIQDSYFYILGQETVEMHGLFLGLVKARGGDLFAALDAFGPVAAEAIYSSEHYMLYRNRYLHFDADTERQWRAYRLRQARQGEPMGAAGASEAMLYVRTLIHSLIQRLFAESWDKEAFLGHYRQYVTWIKRGMEDGSFDGIDV